MRASLLTLFVLLAVAAGADAQQAPVEGLLVKIQDVIASTTRAETTPDPGMAIDWVYIPAGTFQMGCSAEDNNCDGDEYPSHPVTISQPFELTTTEVTVGMLRSSGQAIPEQPEWSTSPDQPVVIVSWQESSSYCEALGGRLLTEAEWEYAARGGLEGMVFPWGSNSPSHDQDDIAGAAFEGGVGRPVATFEANGYGLYDMAGNVWEWVADVYSGYPNQAIVDPTGPDSGLFRSVRGGSYGDDQGYLRVANRNPVDPNGEHLNVGFRCARD